jgi:hypothetical protein
METEATQTAAVVIRTFFDTWPTPQFAFLWTEPLILVYLSRVRACQAAIVARFEIAGVRYNNTVRFLLLISVILVTAVSAASASAPRLTIVGQSPLTVRGAGFTPHSRIRVVANVDGTTTLRPLTNRLGAFVIRFTGTFVPSCTAFSVRAFGAPGLLATLRVAQPECPQPLNP